MQTIKVNWDVNQPTGREDITLEELECETMEQWDALTQGQQRERLQSALYELPERVFIVVDTWD